MPCLSCFSSSVSYVGYPHFHLGCPSGPSCPPACNPRCPSMRSPHVTCGRRLLFSHCSPQRPYIFVHMWLSCFHRLLFTESSPNLVCAEKSRLSPPFRVASYVPPVLETKPPHPLGGEFAPSPPAARCGCLPSQPSALCRRPSYPSELTLPAGSISLCRSPPCPSPTPGPSASLPPPCLPLSPLVVCPHSLGFHSRHPPGARFGPMVGHWSPPPPFPPPHQPGRSWSHRIFHEFVCTRPLCARLNTPSPEFPSRRPRPLTQPPTISPSDSARRPSAEFNRSRSPFRTSLRFFVACNLSS